MKIKIEDSYDGFTVVVDGRRFHIDQEDTREKLVTAFRLAVPSAIVEYEEIY